MVSSNVVRPAAADTELERDRYRKRIPALRVVPHRLPTNAPLPAARAPWPDNNVNIMYPSPSD